MKRSDVTPEMWDHVNGLLGRVDVLKARRDSEDRKGREVLLLEAQAPNCKLTVRLAFDFSPIYPHPQRSA